jgi:hypothetical protein
LKFETKYTIRSFILCCANISLRALNVENLGLRMGEAIKREAGGGRPVLAAGCFTPEGPEGRMNYKVLKMYFFLYCIDLLVF